MSHSVTGEGIEAEETTYRILYSTVVRYWSHDEKILTEALVKLHALMTSNLTFATWLTSGIRANLMDENKLYAYLNAPTLTEGFVNKKRRLEAVNYVLSREPVDKSTIEAAPSLALPRERNHDDRSHDDDDEDEGDEVFKAPERVAPKLVRQQSIAESVKSRRSSVSTRKEAASSVTAIESRSRCSSRASSYYNISSSGSEEDEEEDVTIRSKEQDEGISVTRAASSHEKKEKYWTLILEVDWERTGDGESKTELVTKCSPNGKTLYVLGEYRTEGHRAMKSKTSGKVRERHYRVVLIVTDEKKESLCVLMEARAFFKASDKFRPNTPYFNVTKIHEVASPRDALKAMKKDVDEKSIVYLQRALSDYHRTTG
jgi:hypothetical protein